MAPLDILAVVEDQFYDVRKRLDAQLMRTAEIQQQLDDQRKEIAAQRKEIAEIRRTVDLAHRLLKTLLGRLPLHLESVRTRDRNTSRPSNDVPSANTVSASLTTLFARLIEKMSPTLSVRVESF